MLAVSQKEKGKGVIKSISVTDGSKHHQRISLTLNVYETHIGRWKLKPN